MQNSIKYLIQHPTLVNLLVILLVGIGLLRLSQTRSTNFPSQKVRYIDLAIPYPGASPTEVEEGITTKIEDNLEGISGIDRVTSTSRENLASIQVELEENADADQMLVEVKNAIDRVNNFPSGVEPPSVQKREPLNLTVSFALEGDLPLQTMKDYAEEIRDDLMAAPGISTVMINGAPEEEIEIRVRENDLRTYNITINNVQQAVQNANLETFGGSIETGKENISIKSNEKGYYAKDLQNIVVRATPDGNVVYLKDVAEVADQFKDSPTARYLEGERVMTVTVYTLNDEDILENAEYAKEYITTFNNRHSGVALQILEDGTGNLQDRLKTMVNNGVVGVILVLIVLALFLDKYLAFWVALKIPVAIIGMFVFANIYGLTINVVSLFGFILVLGILVDDGVVIGENIYQHAKEQGKKPLRAALDGTVEMITPVIISLTTTAVAFSLLLFLPTQAGEFFGEMAFVVIAVLFVAFLESFFILPAHLAHSKGLRKETKPSRIERWASTFVLFLRDKVYMKLFRRTAVGRSWAQGLTFFVFIALLVGSIGLLGLGVVNFTFFPNLDDDAFLIELELPPGTPLEVTQQKLSQIAEATQSVNKDLSDEREDGREVVRFVELITGPLDNQGQVKVTMLGGEERGISSFAVSNAIREAAPPIPEATRLIYGLGASTSLFGLPVSFSLKGRNLEELRQAKQELKAAMESYPDVKDVSDNDMQGKQELHIKLKPQAELLGLSLGQVMNQVRAGFFGMKAQSLQRGDNEVEVWVRYPPEGRNTKEELLNMRITTPNGQAYYLKDIASVRSTEGTLAINHLEGQREVRIEANVANKEVSAPKAIAEIEQQFIPDILQKYPSVSYSVEGQNRMSFKLIGAITTIGPIILLFVLALIIINNDSFSQGLLVFGLFPFALIGVITGHWIHGEAVNIFSLIGTIALIGVFVNNALVFISTLNDLLKQGYDFMDAIIESARSRFRPILLTTITTVAGLAPLIGSSSVGAQFLKGPAIAMAYGLGFGIFNVLILLPLLLVVFNRLRLWWHNQVRNRQLSPAEVEPAVQKLKYTINE
ncbi:MAG: efflux RND transporter permease subunit [Bacteroidota bacterium]